LSRGQFPYTLSLAEILGSEGQNHAVKVYDALAYAAFQLDRSLGLGFAGSYHENAFGLGERWLLGAANQWYAILPSGQVRISRGNAADTLKPDALVATLDGSFHADPSKLWNAAAPAPLGGFVTLAGDDLTLTPPRSYVGTFLVEVVSTAGSLTTLTSFNVTVTNVLDGSVSLDADKPTFQWRAQSGVAHYDVWVNDLTTGQVMVLRNANATGTSWVPGVGGALTPGHIYQWYLGAVAGDGSALWSNGQSFSVAALTAPAPLGPSGAASDMPTFSWNAVANADHYDVWVNDLTTGQAMVLRNASATGTSWTADVALTPGRSYMWWVASVSSNGTHLWNAGQAFAVAALPAPTPVGPSGAPGDLPTFTWTAVAGANHYDLWVNDLTNGQAMVLRNLNAAGTSWTADAALTPGHSYIWYVASVSNNGTHFWNAGQAFSVATLPAPTPVGPSDASSDLPTFTWNAVAGVTRYDVWVNDVTTGQAMVLRNANATGTSWSADVALSPGHSYMWYVAAVSSNGTHFWNAGQAFSVTPLPAPTPVGPIGTTSDLPTFRWNAVAGVTRYDVWVNDLTTGQAMVLRNADATGTSWTTDTALSPGHTYRWFVASVSSNGTHFWNAGQAFSVPALAPPTPIGPVGTISNVLPTFTWNAVAGAHHYDVWVNDLTTGQIMVLRNSSAAGTSWTASTALVRGRTYRWFVGAVSTSGVTTWNGGQEFFV